jgi:hypothetical protein
MRTPSHRILHVPPHALDLAQITRLVQPARVAAAVEAQARLSDNFFFNPETRYTFLDLSRCSSCIKSYCCFVVGALVALGALVAFFVGSFD